MEVKSQLHTLALCRYRKSFPYPVLGLRAVRTFRVSKKRSVRLENVKMGHYFNTSVRNLKLCLPVKNKHENINSVLFLQVLTCPCSLSVSVPCS